jgi:hypothetical protein
MHNYDIKYNVFFCTKNKMFLRISGRFFFPLHVSFSPQVSVYTYEKKTSVNTKRSYGPFTPLLMKNKRLKTHIFLYWKTSVNKDRSFKNFGFHLPKFRG